MPRRLTLAAIPLALLVVALVGCTASTRIPPPQPPAASEPLFASDEEALAAATAAYEQYLAVVDAALANPTEELQGNISLHGPVLVELNDSIAEFRREGYVIQGRRSLGGAVLQQSFESNEVTSVIAYFCEDLTSVVLLDTKGNSLTASDRPNFTVFEAQIDFSKEESELVSRDFWRNADSC